jgi:hypothetical protein
VTGELGVVAVVIVTTNVWVHARGPGVHRLGLVHLTVGPRRLARKRKLAASAATTQAAASIGIAETINATVSAVVSRPLSPGRPALQAALS